MVVCSRSDAGHPSLVCAGVLGTPAAEAAAGCRIYVASGDDYPAGNALNDNPSRFPEQLLADHLVAPGWCLYNQGKNGTTYRATSQRPGGVGLQHAPGPAHHHSG